MRHFLLLLFSAIFLVMLSNATLPPDPTPLLNSYKWKNRLLLLFTPAADDALYQMQLKEFLSQQQGLKERDLLIFRILPDHVILPNGVEVGREEAENLRQYFIIPDDETVTMLIGKDGTEKLRTLDLLTNKRLFLTIDAMPMRQEEMKH